MHQYDVNISLKSKQAFSLIEVHNLNSKTPSCRPNITTLMEFPNRDGLINSLIMTANHISSSTNEAITIDREYVLSLLNFRLITYKIT